MVTAQDKYTTSDNNKYKKYGKLLLQNLEEVDIKGKSNYKWNGSFCKGTNSKTQLLGGTDIINAGTVGGIVCNRRWLC